MFPTYRKDFQEKEAFVSFNDDTCASIIIQLLQKGSCEHKDSMPNLLDPHRQDKNDVGIFNLVKLSVHL